MDWPARVRTSVLSWRHQTPLPPGDPQTGVKFQLWHHFDPDSQQWTPARAGSHAGDGGIHDQGDDTSPLLTLLTWNIDGSSSRAEDRVDEIITHATQLRPKVDIIFLPEVSRPALQQTLKDERIRTSWFSSECDDRAWGYQSFANVTLLSRQRFAPGDGDRTAGTARLGPIWRVAYPSRFGRNALCCDIIVPSSKTSASPTRLRLVNVHLDSLPINPSYRPQQLSIITGFLSSADCGVVAGDFNPVLEQDATLVEDNGLTDAWTALHPQHPGFTWGTDGKQPFPPTRLDKVALLGLRPHDIKVVEAGRLGDSEGHSSTQAYVGKPRDEQSQRNEAITHWSDHHALLCSFGLFGE